MANIASLQLILTAVAREAAERYKHHGATAYRRYYVELAKRAAPYVGDGFLDKRKSPSRFIAETAMLYLAAALFEEWCQLKRIETTSSFLRGQPDGRHFVWFRASAGLRRRIVDWVGSHPNIQDAPQAISTVAEGTFVTLRRRALGEFYTPVEVGERLLEQAGLEGKSIVARRIVDPACGSGNLLGMTVRKVARLVELGELGPMQAMTWLNESVHGYDIQPVAVLMTRIQLLLASLPILEALDSRRRKPAGALRFDNIQLTDPLQRPQFHWNAQRQFDVVIGNPPYLKISGARESHDREFDEILRGQPNLYQMFLWWAVKATKPGGTTTFVIPQSIRSGQYMAVLRKHLAEECDMTSITCFTAREGVFRSVEQQVMIISLRRRDASRRLPSTQVGMSSNGHGLSSLHAIRAAQSKVVAETGGEILWRISDSALDYEIVHRVYENSTLLKDHPQLHVANGGFVWNQNKGRLKSRLGGKGKFLPLVSSGSIGPHSFTFPPSQERLKKRHFVACTLALASTAHSGPSILVKRTTPEKMQGRRIVACLVPRAFTRRFPEYFCENHVNIMKTRDADADVLAGISLWLNSRLANFVFGMINGSSHISKYELRLLPVPRDLIRGLGRLKSRDPARLLKKVDDQIFAYYRLSKTERARVRELVPTPKMRILP